MKTGDLILFAWPGAWSKVDDLLDWENARIGLVIEIMTSRPGDSRGDELLVMHEGQRWSVPSAWCKLIKEAV